MATRPSRPITASAGVQNICKVFKLTDRVLDEIMIRFLHEIVMGLGKDTHDRAIVKCFITYVQDLPTGEEKGTFLALDLGGTNFRVLCVYLDTNYFDMKSHTFAIPPECMTGTGEQLFDLVADSLIKFCEEQGLEEQKTPLGFTFSFPCIQKGLTSGILERWTKGFNCSDTVGVDIVKLLREAMTRRGKEMIEVVAILNDTTGTLMSCAWKERSCRIGLIIGTGSNACYVERVDKAELFEGPTDKPYVIINTECGAFGDDGSLDFICTEFDRAIDKNSINPGKQIHEKMISGMYLGELVRLAMLKCIEENVLLGGKGSAQLSEKGSFDTRFVSEIESDNHLNECRNILNSLGLEHATKQDLADVRYICECASMRAAYLVSAAMATLCNRMGFPEVTIAVDGTLFRLHPHIQTWMTEKIQQLVRPGITVNDVCKRLILDDVDTSQVMYKFLQEINKGLGKEFFPRATVKCLITYVQNLPNGKERGKYLALDLGGSNFRIVLVTLGESNYDLQSKMYNIPQNLLVGTGVQLFNYVAESLSNFCQEFSICQKERLPLAFTFGFQVKQQGMTSGILERWSKGFMCSGTVGQDVVKLLRDAINRRGDVLVEVVVLVSETTGTLMSCAWKNHSCRIGVVIGSNCTYVEMKDKVGNFNLDFGNPDNPYVLVNVECACFGDDGALDFIRTEFDKEIDKCSTNPGKQVYEKMVTGANMGEMVRMILIRCIKNNVMFGGKISERLQQRGHFYTKYVSEIESDMPGTFNNCKNILEDLGMKHPSDQDMINLRFICECVSRRSAHLVSACIATLVRKMTFPNVTVAVDGLIYRFHPHYHNLLMDKIRQLCSGGIKLLIIPSEDGGGRGAAIAAAVAARLVESARKLDSMSGANLRRRQRSLMRSRSQMSRGCVPTVPSSVTLLDSRTTQAQRRPSSIDTTGTPLQRRQSLIPVPSGPTALSNRRQSMLATPHPNFPNNRRQSMAPTTSTSNHRKHPESTSQLHKKASRHASNSYTRHN